jgi:hypothetical protein
MEIKKPVLIGFYSTSRIYPRPGSMTNVQAKAHTGISVFDPIIYLLGTRV